MRRPQDTSAGGVAREISVRRARREDLPEIVRLLADDELGSRREQFTLPLPEAYYDAFREMDGDPHNWLVVAVAGGEIVGTLQLTFIAGLTHQGARRAQIEGVRVERRHRGRGVGRRLFEWAIEQAREQGCRMVQLTTDNSRPDALRFYQGLGFVASHVGLKLHLRRGPELS